MKSKITKIQVLKKGLAIVLVLMFTLLPIGNMYGVVNAAANDIEEKLENGETTIEVDDEVELRAIAEIVNTKKNSLKGVVVKLTNNINVSNEQWIPIGTEETPFEGEFDGNEKSINGLTFNKDAYSAYNNVGLFGIIGTSGKVYNLIINNFNISILYEDKDIVPDGFFEGATEEDGSGETTDPTESRETVKYKNAGSIAGINKGSIYNCINMNTNSELKIKAGSFVGGLVGTNEGIITSCTNTVDVIGYDYVGGIAGKNDKTSAIINKSINKGKVEGADSYIGGIVGIVNNGNVNFVHNFGDVVGTTKTGGIIGSIDNEGTGKLQYFLGEGSVTVDGETIDKADKYGDDTKRRILIIGDLNDYGQVRDGVVKIDDIKGFFNSNHVSGLGSWGTEDENRAFIARKEVSKAYWNSPGLDTNKVKKITYVTSAGKTENLFKLVSVNLLNGDIQFNIDDLGANLDTSSLEPVMPEEPEPEPEVVPDYAIDITDKFPKNDGDNTDASKTWLVYKISKIDKDNNVTIIKEGTSLEVKETSFKSGDKIIVETTYNKILLNKDGSELKIENAPALVVKNLEEKVFTCTAVEKVANPDKTKTTESTKITYECEIIENDNYNIESLLLGEFNKLYAVDKDIKAIGIEGKKELPLAISIDKIAPSILEMKVYVEEKLKTGRYPAGTEVIFELGLNKTIDFDKTIVPDILVSFSKSGEGKYNYNIFKDTEGYAKYIGSKEDGKTLCYVYKIQEGDEGYINYTYTGGKLVDFSGNETEIEIPVNGVVEDVVGEPWETDDLVITYKLFKNGEEITEDTEFTKSDKLTVDVKFDKVLYGRIGELNKETANVIFENTDFCKLYVPSLYLKNVAAGEATKIDTNSTDKTTTITYEFDLSTISAINKIIGIDNLVLKNDKNTMVDSEGEFNDGTTYYSSEYKEEYDTAERDLYKEIILNAAKDLNLDYEIIIDLDKESSSEDEDTESGEGQSGKIYADTTAPTVEITTNTSDPTNLEEIEYTFTFSEQVRDFTIDKITVNGGEKVGDLEVIKEGRVYKLKVKPTLINNEGFVQVIVEKGACVDLVAKDVIRQEKNITIDKIKSEFKSASIRREEDKIIIEAIFNENIGKADSLIPALTVGGVPAKGDWEEPKYDGNKVILEYNIDAADGGKVEATLRGTVEDVAGNVSDEVNYTLENNITLDRNVVKPEIGNNYYTFKINDVSIISFAEPHYLRYGDVITVERHTDLLDDLGLPLPVKTYTYELKDNMDLIHMLYMNLADADILGEVGTATFSTTDTNNAINISAANIYFDTISPKVELAITAEEKAEGNAYREGKELIITATTSEAIKESEVPEIKVNFTNSGIGKYNYQKEATKGNAVHIDTITNSNGTITWKYKYVIQSGDDGEIFIGHANSLVITDLAGNDTTLKAYPEPNKGEVNLKDIEIAGTETKVSFNIYKNDNLIENFTDNTYFAAGDTIKVVANFNKLLYRENDNIQTVLMVNEDAPTLIIDGKEFYGKIINTANGDSYKTKGIVEHNLDDYTTQITYNYEVTMEDTEELLDELTLRIEKTIWAFNKEITEEGQEEIKEETIEKIDIKKDIKNCNLHIYNSTTEIVGEDVIADTVAPKVSISANVDSITKANEIIYTFTFNEEVKDFTIDDINVYGGTKIGELEKAKDKEEYTLKVKPNVAEGNEGEVQVVIANDVCTDLIGLGNKGAESIIKVDKKSPIFVGLEAFAKTDSTIKLNEEVDVVKEYYKVGDKITIIATFDESVTTDAKLVLQFSESGNAKGTASIVKSIGNKIEYTYTLAEGDKGSLSVKAFSGKAVDAAGNEMAITKRALDGDTIIADSIAPNLKELKVTSPDSGVYNADKVITIEAIYDEDIYILENDEEIKLINTQIEVQTEGAETESEDDDVITYTNNIPTLMIKFGNGKEKEAKVIGYGTKEDGSVDRTKLLYTYIIVGDKEVVETENEEIKTTIVPGDNGKFSIVSYTNKEGYEVCDKAGNVAELTVNQTGNEITADTTRPEVTNITAVVVEPSVSNTGIYHKAGNKIKITVDFNENVNPVESMPEIKIGFSEGAGVEPESYDTYSFEADCNVDADTVEYTYIIKDGDNGYLWISIPENQFNDQVGNGNIKTEATEVENIFADTSNPTVTLTKDIKPEQNNQEIIIKAQFSENVYDLKANSIVTLTKENAPKLIYSFGEGENREVAANAVNGDIIEYRITKDPVEDNGTLLYELAKGNLSDRAGNEYYVETTDTTAPVLQSVVISSNAGTYDPYCKEGKEIYVIATFNEAIQTHNMKLKAKIGETELADISGVITEENRTQIKFTYTVKAGDMGEFKIVDICGEKDNKITLDNTYGWVKDLYGNQHNIYSLEKEGVTPTGKAIADTKDPYVANVEAIIDGKVVATYAKKDGEVAIVKETRTTKTDVEYVITYSEPIRIIDESKIKDNLNGELKITKKVSNGDEYYNQIVVTVSNIDKVDNASHLITILGEAIEDRAGNNNSKEEFKLVTIDAVKPEVIFTNNDDIKIFVIPTAGTLTIVQGVEFSEDISKIEYKWDNGEYVDITESYLGTQTNRVVIPEKEFTSEGTHKLYVKAIDIAGNIKEVWKEYSIKESEIIVTLSTYELTNQDVKITVNFEEGLTENRIVTFKAEGSNEYVEKTPNADETYTIEENGTVHVKATDKAGHEVFTERAITNIDKEAPVIEIALKEADLVIGTGKDKATIKTDVEVTDNRSLEYAKFAFIQEDINIANINAIDKAKINNSLNNEAKIDNAESTKGKTPYYLYVIAKDEAGTEVIKKSGPYTVLDTNEREKTIITVGEDGKEIITKEPIRAEIEINKLISFNQEGKHISITYNNFGEEYLDIIKEKDITLTEAKDGYIDYEYYSYVDVNKETTITVVGKDACGNTVTNTYEVTRESIEGPEFEVYGNPEYWTNQDVKLEVVADEELSALTVNGKSILSEDNKYTGNVVITENGDYKFIATDNYGLTSEKVIKVTKIDKVKPVISKVETSGKDITVTATDIVNEIEGSGIAEYAITDTTELPVEWSKSNVIKVTNDGAFFVWVRDNAGNVTRTEQAAIVDTTAPIIRFDNTLTTVEAGMPIEANIVTDEEARISYSWDEETWIDSEEFIRSVRVDKKYDITGKYTLYVKAIDRAGNESKAQIEFTVTKPEAVLDPQIVFEDLPTIQIDGVHYVKVAADMTREDVTNKMKKDALCGVTPEYIKLVEDRLKTGSEIALNGDTKYIVIVNGDVNCDGKVGPIDVTYANSIRLNKANSNILQKLAADFDLDGIVKPIDITMINSYRLGKIKGI